MIIKKFLVLLIIPSLFFVSCQKELSVTPDDQLSRNIKLFVDSNPQGAQIFIDNLNMGQRTPDTVEWVEPGEHILKLKLDLYRDTSVTININEDESNSIFMDYISNPSMLGRLNVDSDPRGAEIFINGSNTNFKTPKLLNSIVPGKYEVVLKHSGFWDLTVEETVVTGRTTYIDKKLDDTLTWINYNSSTVGLPYDYFNVIDIQYGYIKWIGGSGLGGLFRYDDNEWKQFTTLNSPLPSDNITAIKVKNDDIWIGTDNGVVHYNNGNWQIYNTSNSPLQTNIIECLYIDHMNRVWIGTYNKGIFVFDGGNWTIFNKNNTPLPTDLIRSILVEPTGNFWIGTLGGGLVQFDGTDWRISTFGIPVSRTIEDIYLDEFSNVFIGCSYINDSLIGGLAIRKNNFWEKTSSAGLDIKDFVVDDQNNMWIVSFDFGLVRYNSSYKVYNSYNSKLFSDRITSIAIDGAGHKWITTYGTGIIKYKGD